MKRIEFVLQVGRYLPRVSLFLSAPGLEIGGSAWGPFSSHVWLTVSWTSACQI